MKAMQVVKFGSPLKLVRLAKPKLQGPFDILVSIHASGVCHTDLHAANGDWPVKPTLPFIPGHEGVGEVVELGDLVSDIKIGDRVGVPWLYSTCGHCKHCLSGWETLCGAQKNTGYSVNGGYAEFAVADSRYVAKIPKGLDYIDISPHFCAGVTTYKAVKVSGSDSRKTVLISGIGGLGHMALQYARVTGARTIAVDTSDDKLELARKLGADETVNALSKDVAKTVKSMGGADIVIATAVSARAFRSAFDSLNSGGTMVVVGIPPEELPIPIFELVLKGIKIIGSIVGTRQDLQETLDLAARRLIVCEHTVARLEDVNDVLDQMRAGEITGRVVLELDHLVN
jgi:alcohol dehydrogenase, propanol-preferring